MNVLRRGALTALVALAVVGVSAREAHALGPVDVELGGRVGIATKPGSLRGPNTFGLGLGARGGLSISKLYVGLSGIHYFGSSGDLPGPGGSSSVRYSSTLVGLEVGYNIRPAPRFLLRPQLGLGRIGFASGDVSDGNLYLEPGLVALIDLGLVYVGADANILFVPAVERGGFEATTYAVVTVHGQIGVHF